VEHINLILQQSGNIQQGEEKAQEFSKVIQTL
jgi:hypothetical protein